MKFVEVYSSHPDFTFLTALLDAELAQRYGERQQDYVEHNQLAMEEPALVGYVADQPVACGCFRQFSVETAEIKRMYVSDGQRRKGYSSWLLSKLEILAYKHGYRTVVLETGKSQPEAIGLYQKAGYTMIDNYPPYEEMENSVCMAKNLEFAGAQRD